MISHAPPRYACPFCRLAAGIEDEHVWSRASDVVYRDGHVLAFVAAAQWPNNPGHVLIVPVAHHENLYDLPDDLGARVHAVSRRVALALKGAFGCDGVSTRQHNEPAGNQDVWHYHLHVFPRWHGDGLYGQERARVAPGVRAAQAARLRPFLEVDPTQAYRHSGLVAARKTADAPPTGPAAQCDQDPKEAP